MFGLVNQDRIPYEIDPSFLLCEKESRKTNSFKSNLCLGKTRPSEKSLLQSSPTSCRKIRHEIKSLKEIKTRKKKVVSLCLVALLAMGALIGGTMAYFTSQDVVNNTFTVGDVTITLDEADVDEYGVVDSNADRVKVNTCKLIPGKEYVKDPVLTVKANSEKCYVFVKVENGLSGIEDNTATIASQLSTNGWTALSEGSNVYYKANAVESSSNDQTFNVFEKFKLAGNADLGNINTDTKIIVTGYAVQAEGFNSAEAAWATTFGASND